MTKDLTEQWKKGELEDGYYYVKLKGDRDYMLLRDDNHWYEFGWDCWFFDDDIVEILAEIPSYEEWQKMKEQRNQLIRDVKDLAYIQEEKAKLKEDYNRLGKLLQKMEDSDNAREKFQNGQIEKLKDLLNYIRDEIADMPSCSYQWGFGWVHEAAYKIDEVLNDKECG